MSNSAGQLVVERLRQAKFFLYADSIPNVQIVLEACQRNEVEPELIWREDVVDEVIERCIAGATFGNYTAKIAENSKLREALDAVYVRYPRFARNVANDRMIIEAAARHRANFDAQTLVNMVTEDATLFNSLAKSQQFNEQQAALREREEGIAYLTKNGTSSFTVGKQTFDKAGYLIERSANGNRTSERRIGGKNDEGFPGWTDEQLRYAVERVKATRESLQQQKDGTLGKTVDQTLKNNLKERLHGDPYAYKPPMPTDKTVPAALVDPRNGQPITTRIQLLNYVNSDRNALARLIKPHGVTIAERARAVDILLSTR